MGIYEDIATLQSQMTQAQSDITTLQNNIENMGCKPIPANSDLDDLTEGYYYIVDYDTCITISNRPDTTGQTATIEVLKSGNNGQLIMIYSGCIKEYINVYMRVYYADGWGDWLKFNNDTGWINLPLNTGWSCSYNTDVAMYRKIGNVVHLRGLLNATQAAGKVIGTLPEGFRPSGHFERFTCPHQQSGNVNIEVGYTGQIKDYTKPDNTGREFISLYGISYIV